ncbi:MAG: DNA alkylation repair protein [Bacteroidales bacterium]|nr:DNA alkylation repair protein [Bacteroidales bacterium]
MHPYLIPVLKQFNTAADPEIAFYMKKYMKERYAYFGIKSPGRREILATFLNEHGYPDISELEAVAKDCWEQPQREFQYFIMEILGKLAKKAEKELIDLYEYMVENKSWWDTVDYIASNLVGVHFQKYPELIRDFTGKWMDSGNIWLQRTAILFQLKYKKNTDLELLTDYISRLQGSKEFFINKAVGWMLREYSKTDGAWVLKYVESKPLAPLSKREALKWLERKSNAK